MAKKEVNTDLWVYDLLKEAKINHKFTAQGSNIKEIHEKEKNTIILVSHSMDDVAKLADRLLVMNHGKVEFFDTPTEVFKNEARLKEIGLDVPQVLQLANQLREKGFEISSDILTIDDIKNEIVKNLKRS